jgi:hypothetical protein
MTQMLAPETFVIFTPEQLVTILQEILDQNPEVPVFIDHESLSEKGYRAKATAIYQGQNYVFEFWLVKNAGRDAVVEVIEIK